MERASRQTMIATQDQLLARLQDAYAHWKASQTQFDLYRRQILPQAAMAMKSAEASYETGRGEFMNFVDTARQFKKSKLGELTARVEYHKSLTHLKEAIGKEF